MGNILSEGFILYVWAAAAAAVAVFALGIALFFIRLPKPPDKETSIFIPANKISCREQFTSFLINYWSDKFIRAEITNSGRDVYQLIGSDGNPIGTFTVTYDDAQDKYRVRMVNCPFD